MPERPFAVDLTDHHGDARTRLAIQCVLHSLLHIGCGIPPTTDAGWIGDVGSAPRYLDPGSGGPENDFTHRNTTHMIWNVTPVARSVKNNGGSPYCGSVKRAGNPGELFGFDASLECR